MLEYLPLGGILASECLPTRSIRAHLAPLPAWRPPRCPIDLAAKNTQNNTSKEGVCSLEIFLPFGSKSSLWLSFRGVKTIHSG